MLLTFKTINVFCIKVDIFGMEIRQSISNFTKNEILLRNWQKSLYRFKKNGQVAKNNFELKILIFALNSC